MKGARKIIKRNPSGDIVAIYPTVALAAEQEGVTVVTIRKWCQVGRGGKRIGGYIFEYDKDVLTKTLCWDCQNACGGCSWSKAFKPVNGWTAERKDVKVNHTYRGRSWTQTEESYIVKKCPEFLPDKRQRER